MAGRACPCHSLPLPALRKEKDGRAIRHHLYAQLCFFGLAYAYLTFHMMARISGNNWQAAVQRRNGAGSGNINVGDVPNSWQTAEHAQSSRRAPLNML